MCWSSILLAQTSKLLITDLYPKADLSNIDQVRRTFNKMLCADERDLSCSSFVPYYNTRNYTRSLVKRQTIARNRIQRIWDFTIFSEDISEECKGEESCASYFDPDGIDIRIYEPYRSVKSAAHPIIIWVHGGGFVLGHHYDNSKCIALANRTSSVVISIEYRLAPDYPYGQHDVLTAVKWIASSGAAVLELESADPHKVYVFGESAGGHHTASAMLDVDIPSIKGMVFIYPEIEYGGHRKLPSEIEYENINGLLRGSQDEWFWTLYLGSHLNATERMHLADSNFRINLLNTPDEYVKNFASKKIRVLVLLAKYDILYSEGKAYVDLLEKHGVDVLSFEYNTVHGFFGIDTFDSSLKSMTSIFDFLSVDLNNQGEEPLVNKQRPHNDEDQEFEF
jgi:acetyl esterase